VKKAPLILMALNGFVWGGMSWIGWGLIKANVEQNLAGHPNPIQIWYYLVFPLLMLSASLVPAALLGQTKWSVVANVWCSLTLLAVLLFFFTYTGGV
jgi:hypothetical protein